MTTDAFLCLNGFEDVRLVVYPYGEWTMMGIASVKVD